MIVEYLQKILNSKIEIDFIEVTVNLKTRFPAFSKIKLTQNLINDWVEDEEVKSFNITLNFKKGSNNQTLQYKNGWYSAAIIIHGTANKNFMLYEIYGDTVLLNLSTYKRKFKTEFKNFETAFARILKLHAMLLNFDHTLQKFIKESKNEKA